jgi:hypothetical protein
VWRYSRVHSRTSPRFTSVLLLGLRKELMELLAYNELRACQLAQIQYRQDVLQRVGVDPSVAAHILMGGLRW